MRFAGAGRPESKAVLASVDPFAARQFQNQRLVQRRFGGEFERIEALGLWKARQPNAALDVAAFAIDALQFAQAQQIARVLGPAPIPWQPSHTRARMWEASRP